MFRLIKYIGFLTLLLLFAACRQERNAYYTIDGFTQGTSYHIIYHDVQQRDLSPAIDSILKDFSKSLSVYDSLSLISKINRNETTEVDQYFAQVFHRAKEIYNDTRGALDISAAPLFNAWGFGFKKREKVTPQLIDSLKTFTGMDKVRLEGRQIVKSDARITFNMNAIAQGYSVDVVCEWFASQGIADYLVEIGGEIRCHGKNKKGNQWAVGIDKPEENNMTAGEHLQTVVHFTNRAMATSGNYRKFYVENGEKYSHTINPASGRPVTHSLLSATLFTADAMTADAYATVCMVVGLERAKEILQQHPEWGAYLIYEKDGMLQTFTTADVQDMMK
ncbi:MAG: FAD:protein FMN transferase [Prevotellaceae bacterium]|jgi:thiamine biosynthesis lipoprotein|nr:FAD:protein FMN transferase [Prevotellaceae bacterium]